MTFDLEKARACAAFVDPKEAFLEALDEIERLRAEKAGLSKAVIDIQEERDLAQAEFRNINSGIETPWNCINATMGIRYRYTKLCGGVVQE